MCLWKVKAKTKEGISARIPPAANSVQAMVVSPKKLVNPTVSGLASSVVVSMEEKRNSFQVNRKAIIALAEIPILPKGKKIFRNMAKLEAPSIFAASSNSPGIVLKKPIKIHITKGKLK